MRLLITGLLLISLCASGALARRPFNGIPARRGMPGAGPGDQDAQQLMNQGNWKEAYDKLSVQVVDPAYDPATVTGAYNQAVQCLQNLGDVKEFDDLSERTVAAHGKSPHLLMGAAQMWLQMQHQGTIVAGKFERGPHRGGTAKFVETYDHDRGRALQLMVQGLPYLGNEGDKPFVVQYYHELANTLMNTRYGQSAWALQALTDLTKLADPEETQNFYGYYGQPDRGAPVDADGNPVFHKLPKSWEDAKSDGERWRWALQQSIDAGGGVEVKRELASFYLNQFGVQTMAAWGYAFGRQSDDKKDESGPFALRSLSDEETIARLASGIKRFKMPDEFNYVRLFRELADQGDVQSMRELASIYENRQQYPKAAEWFAKVGDTEHVQQIRGNWGQFEQSKTQPSGVGASVDFRFRNGAKVSFVANEIDVEKLTQAIRAHLESHPNTLDYEKVDLGQIGYALVQGKREKFKGPQVAQWDLKLEPRPDHLDRRITVTTPLSKGGAYLVSAQMEDGNTSYTVLWVADLAIVKKQLDGQVLYYTADARTGAPAAGAKLEFFGYRTEWHDRYRNGQQVMEIITESRSDTADADGQVFTTQSQLSQNFQWLVTVKDASGRFGWYGWTNQGYGNWYDQEYSQARTFFISDRPVYRPGHTVKFKFWANRAQYDQEGDSPYAGNQATFTLSNPKGENSQIGTAQHDRYGGVDGTWKIPDDAPLGVYTVNLNGLGSGTFRVEEYKKPEFEVTVDAPKDPVELGDKFEAKIEAKYLFGAPVKEGKVKYKVTRVSHDATWYPYAPWDWYYGRGYWWFACDYIWYPGWFEWGCKRPAPWWMVQYNWAPPQQPEIVAENEGEIGSDGTVKVPIDTALAKATQGDIDHKYEISVEVTDKSRRTITGSGSVIVARRPFKVYTWLDRGHYKVGDTIDAQFNAQTVDGKPVSGPATLKLLKLKYDAQGVPTETAVQNWTLATDATGRAHQQMTASEPGQYRLSTTVTDAKGHAIEGGYVFVISGPGFDGSDFRFNALELVADAKQYSPGQKVQLRVNTNRRDGTVLLFVRATNGVCKPPKVLRLNGKSALEEIEVVKKDMPNFFIEALTISDATVHSETLELVVPPEKRVLDVKVEPAAERVKPGSKAKVKIKVALANGEPYAGSLVISMYDKAVDYISGGSNVGDIREAYWKWRRSHNPQRESSLDRAGMNMVSPGQNGMGTLGVFGGMVADMDGRDAEGMDKLKGASRGRAPGRAAMMMKTEAPMAEGMAVDSLSAAAAPAPMAPPPPGGGAGGMAPVAQMAMSFDARNQKKDAEAGGDAQSAPPVQMAAATVRSNFADTAFWTAALETDKAGEATIEVPMPENLTTWSTKVWAMSSGCRVGQGDAQVITTKNLVLRLQAPRFFVESDEIVLSANVHNYLKEKKSVQAVLEVDGGTLQTTSGVPTTQTVSVDAGGEARVDWRVKVLKEGKATIRMKALTDEESDAMQMEFPVLVHGTLKTESFCGVIRPEGDASTVKITVPDKRKPEQSRLEIRYSPTLAMAMVDALPYLIEYPYGCTEQTLNRFLPTVLTQKTFIQLGVNLEDIATKITNLNAQEIGDDQKRSEDWHRLAGTMRWNGKTWVDRNPVFDPKTMKSMIKAGIERLEGMQCSDGGWGWFSGDGEHSAPHTTALVVHGLQVAQFDDAAIPRGMLERGVQWLKGYQEGEWRRLNLPPDHRDHKAHADELDAFVSMVLTDAKADDAKMRGRIYDDRNNIAVYAKAMLGLALHKNGETEKRDMIIRNIEQFLKQDDENQTAYLKLPEDNWWWYWYGSEYEAQAYYLKLLAAVEPKGQKASRLVKYLLNNRRNSTYWNSTRDTAVVVEAFADYIRGSGEDRPDMNVEVKIDGKSVKTVKIAGDNLFTYDNKVVLTGAEVTAGAHTIELKRTGRGPLYWNAYLTNFTQEDRITKAGLEIKVERQFYKLIRVDAKQLAQGDRGQVLEQKIEKYRREPIADLATLKSGELVEVELVIESKNDYEYIMLEDAKAAGFECTEVRSGYNGNDMGAYVEFRDQKVSFFVRQLARGKHSVSYRMRAEIPGKFSALPTRALAMYAPELRANSDEFKVGVED